MSDTDTRTEIAPLTASEPSSVPVAASIPVAPRPAATGGLVLRRLQLVSSLLTVHAQRLGAVGISGMAALVFAVAFLCSSVLPLRGRVTELRNEVSTASVARVAPRAAPPREQAAAFIAGLPQRKSLPGVLAAIVQQAEAAGLSLDRGVYQWSVGKSGAIAQYQLTLPVKGSYPEVRKFVDATLAAVPAAALAGITLGRPNVGDAQVTADLRFLIFVRSAE